MSCLQCLLQYASSTSFNTFSHRTQTILTYPCHQSSASLKYYSYRTVAVWKGPFRKMIHGYMYIYACIHLRKLQHIYVCVCLYKQHMHVYVCTQKRTRRQPIRMQQAMGWRRLVGSIKSQVSFAKELYKRDDILEKRSIILKSLLIVATPYTNRVYIWRCLDAAGREVSRSGYYRRFHSKRQTVTNEFLFGLLCSSLLGLLSTRDSYWRLL